MNTTNDWNHTADDGKGYDGELWSNIDFTIELCPRVDEDDLFEVSFITHFDERYKDFTMSCETKEEAYRYIKQLRERPYQIAEEIRSTGGFQDKELLKEIEEGNGERESLHVAVRSRDK